MVSFLFPDGGVCGCELNEMCQLTCIKDVFLSGEEQRADGAVEKKGSFGSAVRWSLSEEGRQVRLGYYVFLL